MTPDELLRHYSWLHEHTGYGACHDDRRRAQSVFEFLASHLDSGASVLDCSGGRGYLALSLAAAGYVTTVTEADPYLCAHDLRDLAPKCLRYDQLATLAPQKYDAVVSIDVLEHLLTEADAITALRDLAALSRRWLCVSVGITESFWESEHDEKVKLHYVVRDVEWWTQAVEQVARIVETRTCYRISHMMFAEVPQCPTA